MNIEINFDGLYPGGAPLGDLTELMTILAGRAVKMIDRKFQQSGPEWVPLAERTLASRRKRGKGAKPLLDTNQLRGSVVAAGPGGVFEVTGDGFKIGTNLVKAATHQFGNPNGFGRGVKIPARPYMPTEEECAREFIPVIERYLADKLK